MLNFAQIAVFTPATASLQSPSDRIVLYQNELLTSHDRTPGTTSSEPYCILAPVTGELPTAPLLRITQEFAAAGQPALRLLPLATCEWLLRLDGLSGFVLSMIPGIERTCVAVAPRELLRGLPGAPDGLRWIAAILFRAGHDRIPVSMASWDGPPPAPQQLWSPPALVPTPRPGALATSLKGAPFAPSPERDAVYSGLAQINDDLDLSHQFAQRLEGDSDHTGDFWHAIMHRREPDYGNAAYWFRRIGNHPVLAELAPLAAGILSAANPEIRDEWRPRLGVPKRFDPLAFVKLCEAAAPDEAGLPGHAARAIQWCEMLLLLRHSTKRAQASRPL